MKVVIGPLNIASQPYYLAQGLRKYGVDATCVTYGESAFGYGSDWSIPLPQNRFDRVDTFTSTLKEAIGRGFDIFHFFQKSFFFSIPSKNFDKMSGLDIVLLKARGFRVAYRFTGWEVIDREVEIQNNPHSAFLHGWDGAFNTDLKQDYLEFLREYVDAFMVVDPMMREHCQEADIVPRILPVHDFAEVGIERKSRPLIVHAPSNSVYKGSSFVLKALRELKDEGVQFDLQLLHRVPHDEALEWFKRADIVIDQMLIGWYGVLAMECMAMGKPVAVYMRTDLANTPDEIPIWNLNIKNIKDRLRVLIEDFDLRETLAKRSRGYVEATHSEDVVIPKLISVYDKIMSSPSKTPHGFADVDFLNLQRRRWETLELENIRARKTISRIKKTMPKTAPYTTVQVRTLKQRLHQASPEWIIALWRDLKRMRRWQ